MKSRLKLTLLALSTGLITLNTGACLFRFMGDFLADQFWLARIP